MKNLLFLLAILLGIYSSANSQVAINTDGSSPHASAMLDITSTSKGMLIPRLTTTKRTAIVTPANGLMVFDTSEKNFWYYDGVSNSWKVVGNSTELRDADGDTKIQLEETTDEDIIRFDIAGTEYFVMKEGRLEFVNNGSSVFIGENAGLHDDLTNSNTFVGYESGKANTTGSANVGFGYQSLLNCSSNNNVGIGSQSLYNTTGSNNTGLGFQTGYSVTSGSGNVFIGFQTGQFETGSNKLYIDNTNTSAPLIYGEFDNDILTINGHMGVGTDGNSSNALEVRGENVLKTAYFKNNYASSNVKVVHSIYYGSGNNDAVAVFGDATPVNNSNYGYGASFLGNYMAMKAESDAGSSTGTSFGVKATCEGSDGTRYGVYGEAQGGLYRYGVFGTADAISNSYALYCSGNGVYTGTWSNASDKKLKKNIEPMQNALEKIINLKPATYEFKIDEYSYMSLAEGLQFGFIAQELEIIFPELVSIASHPKDTGKETNIEEFKAINYIGLIPVLTQAINEQQLIMENQDKSIEELIRRIELVENKLNK